MTSGRSGIISSGKAEPARAAAHLVLDLQDETAMTRQKKMQRKVPRAKKKEQSGTLVTRAEGAPSGWWPFTQVEEWHRDVDDLFSRFAVPGRFEGTAFGELPALESFTAKAKHVIRMDLPGVDAKEIDISLAGDVLTVKGERRHQEEVKQRDYARREIAHGSFERAATLPEGADTDKIQARFDKGVLEITMPVTTQTAPPKKVDIEAMK
jgi:HSP20 family protein